MKEKIKRRSLFGHTFSGAIPLDRGRDSERRMLSGRRSLRRRKESNATALRRIRQKYQKPEEEK